MIDRILYYIAHAFTWGTVLVWVLKMLEDYL